MPREITLIQLLKSFRHELNISTKTLYYAMILITGLTYLSGYLINTIFLRSIGIESNALLRAQHIETGVVFIFYTFSWVLFFNTYSLIVAVRGKENASLLKAVIATGVICIFIIVLPLISLFTKDDWVKDVSIIFFTKTKTMRTVFIFYTVSVIFGIFCVRYFEDKKRPIKSNMFRVILVAITGYYCYILYAEILWLKYIVKIAIPYLTAVGMLGFIFWGLLGKLKSPRYTENPNLKYKTIIFSLVFIIPLFYMTLINYTKSIYQILPTNRGGKLPVTWAHITLKLNMADLLLKSFKEELKTATPLYGTTKITEIENIKPMNEDCSTIYSLYVIEQNDDNIYVSINYPAFEKIELRKGHTIKRSDIATITYEKCDIRQYYLKHLEQDKNNVQSSIPNHTASPINEKHFTETFTDTEITW